MFLLFAASLSSAACKSNNILFVQDATPVRLSNGTVTTTVVVQCDGDCAAEASHCARVIWQNTSPVDPVTLDDSETCSKTPPAGNARESLVVTSKSSIPESTSDAEIMGTIELVDTSGQLLPSGTTDFGGAETTELGISAP
jgi:hypothetical protein